MSHLWGITSETLHGSTAGMAFLPWLLLPSLSRKLSCCGDLVAARDGREHRGSITELGLGRKVFSSSGCCCCCVLLTLTRDDTAPFLTVLFVLQTISKLNVFVLYFQANSMMLWTEALLLPMIYQLAGMKANNACLVHLEIQECDSYSTVTLITVTCLHFQAAFSV